MRSRFSLVALAVAAALPSVAPAVDFSYNGFSTAAYATSDTDDALVGYAGQPEGIDSEGSYKFDSKLGVQVTAKFNDMVSATVQGVAYTDLEGDFEPHLDWAYLKLQPLQNLSFRAGYMRAPTYMYSDSIFIGYSNVWVRAPLEVYGLGPVYQIRGVDATWNTQLGGFSVSVNPYYGDTEVKTSTGTLDVPNWGGLVTTVQRGSFQARVGYSKYEFGNGTASLQPALDALRAIPTVACGACASEADKLDLKATDVENYSVGVQYDNGTNFLATEYASKDTGGSYVVPSRTGAYVTYGRRFGGLMPYATYAISRRDEVMRSNAIPASGSLVALNATVNAILGSGNTDQDSYSAGVRYEIPAFSVLKAALVKLQFDHIDTDGRKGNLVSVLPGYDGKVNMVSASFDFIF